jgi:ribosomal protein S18 acetylase RimI-like enzyme
VSVEVAIAPLDLGDRVTLHELVALQRASYRVEAELIGASTLPPIEESPEQLRASGELFLGAFAGGRMVGAVAWRRVGDLVDIHRLVVHPSEFRRGVAGRLLDALEERETDARRFVVGTGALNHPARSLYERRGFRVTEERVVGDGVRWVRLDRGR